jgi:FtsZ-interacting cell division protein ZipA
MIPRSAYIAIAIILAIFGIYRWGFHKGWSERDAEMQAQIAIKNEEAREIERVMTSKINNTATKLEEANNAIDEKQSALDRAIRAGRVRFPTSSCVQAPASTASAPTNPETGSESDQQTLLLIAQIAADGDKAINSLNACIDSYNQVREQINGNR